jgi:5-methylcytosine-specific restriction protein A
MDRFYLALGGCPQARTDHGDAVQAEADVIGRSFQGKAAVRAIGDADQIQLRAYAEVLPREPRARLLPEERLEALFVGW